MIDADRSSTFQLSLVALRSWFGIGVAGNFAGHLEQAGEDGDFASADSESGAPKGIFPFYAPGHDSFLGVFPLSHDAISLPAESGEPDAGQLQAEPEVGLACSVRYAPDGSVAELEPIAFGACNDCSIRRPGAAKISEKKNWGACSKGIAPMLIPLGGRQLAEATAGHRLACFLRRDGELHAYGVDSPLSGYSYYGERLLAWIVDRLNGQQGGPDDPLEPVGRYMGECGRPANMLVAIGATRYTELGERTFLEPGDESIVVVYDTAVHPPETVPALLTGGGREALGAASVLIQRVG